MRTRPHFLSLLASCSQPFPSTGMRYFKGLEQIITSNNINGLVGRATVQDALSLLGLVFIRGRHLFILAGLLIQLMEPVDNVTSNNSFPCT